MQKNVLVVSTKYPPEYAGAAKRAHTTYKKLAERYGVSFDVLSSSSVKNGITVSRFDGVKILRVACKLPRRSRSEDIMQAKETISKIIRKIQAYLEFILEGVPTFIILLCVHKKYSIFHIYGKDVVTAVAVLFAKIFKKPVIIEIVNYTETVHMYYPRIIQLLFGQRYPEKATIVCISKYLKKLMMQAGYAETQLWCRPNPIDESRYFMHSEQERQGLRSALTCFSEDDTILLYIAKFKKRKRQDFLVDVMMALPKNYKLILIGPIINEGVYGKIDKEYYSAITNKIKQYMLQARIMIIHSYVNNPQDYYTLSDVFLMPAEREGFGTVFLEAMACGLPVVANNLHDVYGEWIRDGNTGYLRELNVEEWVNAVKLSANIEKKGMGRIAGEILSVASSDVIYKGYYDCLQRQWHNN